MGISHKEVGMRIDLGAKVRTKDGHDAGSVRRVIVDPSSQHVTGFVVSTSRLLGRDVIVAGDAFLSGSGDTVTLDLTKEELERQPSFEQADYTVPPVGWVAPLGYGLPADAYLLPVVLAPPSERESGAPTIKKGDAVKDRTGSPPAMTAARRMTFSSGGSRSGSRSTSRARRASSAGTRTAKRPIDSAPATPSIASSRTRRGCSPSARSARAATCA